MSTHLTPPQVVGLVGSFGSGCTYVAEHIFSGLGYERLSLSDLLREEPGCPKDSSTKRCALQEFGDNLRKTRGSDYLATKAVERIQGSQSNQKWVIDSIRNPEEGHFLRRTFNNFYLFGVFADKECRWDRVKKKYDLDRKQFDRDDETDAGRNNENSLGQRVSDCFFEADIVIKNEAQIAQVGNAAFQNLEGRIKEFVGIIEHPQEHGKQPQPDETLMAMAYAVSQRSSCLKRKVGALIVDSKGTVVSSGFNEVPASEKSCYAQYTRCYRQHAKEQVVQKLLESNTVKSESTDAFRTAFDKNLKVLDYCRALHAEENAIVGLARNAVSAGIATSRMYSTTYPCRLCANKIASLGLQSIIYLEPYPSLDGHEILVNQGVEDQPFEGVTYRAYFRVYGEHR